MKNVVIDVLPRRVSAEIGELPARVRQHPARRGKIAYALAALLAALKVRPSIIFCGHIYTAPLAALIARLTGAKLILQMHGIDAWDEPSSAQRRAAEQADLILCVSRYTRARVLQWADVPSERIAVLPNTVAEDYTPGDRTAARKRFGLSDEFALLSVSRLDPRESYKGHDRVIPLLPKLKAGDGDTIYLIAGAGDDRPRLEALAREHGVTDQVRFLGHVPREDLPDLYCAADLFVLPSTGEGFGIVFLEAMACGTPVLGLAAGGTMDALADGELGAAVSEESLSTALTNLLGAASHDPRALAARVRTRFGQGAFQDTVEAVLTPLLS